MCTRGVPERLWAAVPRGARALVIAANVERVDSSAYSSELGFPPWRRNTQFSKRACDRPLTGVGWCVVPLNGCVRASDRRHNRGIGAILRACRTAPHLHNSYRRLLTVGWVLPAARGTRCFDSVTPFPISFDTRRLVARYFGSI
jgi:hypothetical protein